MKHPQKTTPEDKGGSSSFYHLFSGRFGGFYGSFLTEKARAAWVLSASAGGTGSFSTPAATHLNKRERPREGNRILLNYGNI